MERYSRRYRLRLHAIIAAVMLLVAVLLWFTVEHRQHSALRITISEQSGSA